jgi:predicted ATPase
MIESLEIEKFKCFHSLHLPLAPLTVLTGFNAAGKSTSMQALLLLAQTSRLSPQSPVVALNGPLTRLGSVGDVVTHNSDGMLSLGIDSSVGQGRWDLSPSRELDSQFMKLNKAAVLDENGNIHESTEEFWPHDLRKSPLLEMLHGLIYISSSRDTSTEAFLSPFETTSPYADVGPKGEFAAWWYTKAADDEVDVMRRHPTEERLTVRGQIDAWLGELFPGASVNAETVAKTSLSRLEFRVGRAGDWHRPSNTGYGLSYVFPILVALTTMKSNQVIIIDAPEGHLHPMAQTKMGTMLSRFAAAGLQIVIESHSDHILSGVRIGVKDKIISPADVALHFFQGQGARQEGVSIITPTLDANGSVDFWPEGFFDQSERDLAKLTGWN